MSSTVPRILVTGASGLLGRAVVRALKEKEWDVVGIAFSRVGPELIKCDLTNPEAVSTLINKEKPDFIIHAAAERFPDVVENKYEETLLLNVKASGHLSSLAHQHGSKVIHISTDYVFDGTSPPYKANDKCNPLSKYGQTKLDSEEAVLRECPDACILRVPVLYGPVERVDESAITCLLSALKNSEPKTVSHYDKRCPAHVRDVAGIILDMISLSLKGETVNGIFQWSGREKLTKYEMVLIMSEVFSLPHDHITPSYTPGELRPYDPEMDVSRLVDLGISHHTRFEDGIKECLSPWL
ncbi:methionine adenosyltransferase 2 subunit beta [Procambarus clarkii]|uniref:methionine adenosyltransferase 2 subunit beta n=1 Tax=Procambarus clarkii TaxID=6728 RepID=UPI001E6710D4|nr:methionine adenosyltransferase 2 subunit beta-like [Procambarus clarkii]XP_045606290.1 methionine adenosyltransferase 2 subunit beta-like [Procambarus clarkii]XP_045606291.1 methionine adenosyltransferase 2 subunit beta-like [Procambarus clarkii]XP_045606292.1 methionine adenosyltransferase 2 subunit beta-like [Procambarus clarkii]